MAYKDKVRTYHPDINADPEAEEITKYLNIAKDALDTPAKKEAYDRELKLAYLYEIQQLRKGVVRKANTIINRRERKRKREEQQKIRVKQAYEESLKRFPLRFRIIGLSVMIAWGLQIFYTHYFVLYGTYDMLYNVLGLTLFVVATAAATNEIYTHYMVRSIEHALRFHYEKFATWFFVLMMLGGPLGVLGLNNFRMNYLLKHDYVVQEASVETTERSMNKVIVYYMANGQEYAKIMEYPAIDIIIQNKKKLTIKYAKHDPRIAVIVDEPLIRTSE